MEVKDLIAHFAACESVPVDVQDDVVPVLKANSNFELYFWPNDAIDTGIYKGQMEHWEYPDGNGGVITVYDVQYSSKLSPAWARLVCCKELIHILDPVDQRVMTDDGFSRLVEKIVLPAGMGDASDGSKVWNDRFAIYYALAILFPWATRQLFKEPLHEGKITIADIAVKVDLPESLVNLVMHEVWEETHHLISTGSI